MVKIQNLNKQDRPRENLLYTFIDFYVYIFSKKPPTILLEEIAENIRNIFQIDGFKYAVLMSCKNI